MAQRTSEEIGAAGPSGDRARASAGVKAPVRAGVSLEAEHFAEALSRGSTAVGWFETHPEPFLIGGPARLGEAADGALALLERLREDYPISLHGIDLGFGAERDLDAQHLKGLTALFERLSPCLFSEHLAWSSHTPYESLDGLPPPYDEATLGRVARHIDQTQQAIGRQVLLENPVQHIRLINSTMSETEFLSELVQRTGCGLLLDVNNVFISAANSSATAEEYLTAFPVEAIGEIHLGGHTEALDAEGRAVLVDSAETPQEVWALYEALIGRIGPRPTLIEWDGPAPDWERLEGEAARVNALLSRVAAPASAAS